MRCVATAAPRRPETVGRKIETGSFDLPAKHIQLVAQHDDLEIFGGLAPAIWDKQPEQRPEHQIRKRSKHRPPSLSRRSGKL